MLDQLHTKPCHGHRVTSLKLVCEQLKKFFPDKTDSSLEFPLMKVSVQSKKDEYFSHVVSAVTFGSLKPVTIDQSLHMSYRQRQAIRTPQYSKAVKVAIKFKTR
jgi:hypothetical protein